jgi:hypothetical protein
MATRKHIAGALKAGQRVECYATGVVAEPDPRYGFAVWRTVGPDERSVVTTYKRASDAAAAAVALIDRFMRGGY